MIEVLKCPACQEEKSSLFDEREMRGTVLRNRICRRCGLVYLSRRLEDGALEEFYERGYRLLNDGSELPTEQHLAEQRARTLHLVEVARRIAPEVRRHLDIGASVGILMAGVREAYGCVTVGVEPTLAHRNIALGKGLCVYRSIEEALGKEPSRFDLVTLSHVLEHLPDPVATLRLIRTQLLADGGHVLVEVPNLYGHSCFEPAHLFSYSRKTLHDALKLAGFDPVYTALHGIPRSAWRPRYLLTVARPVAREDDSVRRPGRAWLGVRGAKLRRRWGLRNSRGVLQLAGALGRRIHIP